MNFARLIAIFNLKKFILSLKFDLKQVFEELPFFSNRFYTLGTNLKHSGFKQRGWDYTQFALFWKLYHCFKAEFWQLKKAEKVIVIVKFRNIFLTCYYFELLMYKTIKFQYLPAAMGLNLEVFLG